jgi:hypothetical protein
MLTGLSSHGSLANAAQDGRLMLPWTTEDTLAHAFSPSSPWRSADYGAPAVVVKGPLDLGLPSSGGTRV